jgi:hypothetical protein
VEQLSQDQIDVLQAWGAGLAVQGESVELRAAGRAITLLTDELARRERELWHTRIGSAEPAEQPEAPLADSEKRDRPAVVPRLRPQAV